MRRFLFAIILFTALAAKAEEPLDSISWNCALDEVVITATRTPKTLKNSPTLTRLISADEIRRADPNDIQDLLQNELPGIEFSYAMNQQLNMNLAGFAGQSVLFLVNGERLAGETMDNIDFSRINLNAASRVEIVRGAASALYGSNAVGGVINIITDDARQSWEASAAARAGSHGLAHAYGRLAMKKSRWSNVLDLDFSRADSYNVCLDFDDDCDFRRICGYHSCNFADRLSFSPLQNLKITARAGYYFKQRLYNPDIPDRYRDFSGGLRADWTFSQADRLEIAYSFDQYDKSDFNRSFNTDIRDYSNVQHSLRACFTHTLRVADTFTAGADFLRDWLSSYQFAGDKSHHQYSADMFAQYDWLISDRLEVVAAIRYDWFSDSNLSHISPKINARYILGRVTLRGGYAAGFRAPSLKEKYMDFDMAGIFDIHGNSALKAECSHNFNLSAEYPCRNFYFTASANYSRVKNRISTSAIRYDASGDPFIDYINIGNIRIFSFDATAKARWICGLEASLSYIFTKEEAIAASLSQYCPARPHSLIVKASKTTDLRPGKEFFICISGRFLSAVSYKSMFMYEPFETRTVENPAYMLWKVQLSQRICPWLRLSATIDNLLNYHPAVYSFNAPVTAGTSFIIGINFDLNQI